MKKHTLAALAASIVTTLSAQAGFLDGRTVTGTYSLDININGGAVSGLEASAVTYARDRGSLFFVGDEGTGVVEISKTGQTLGAMSFNWSGTASTNHDTEGLAYLGNGVLVVGEERLYDAYRFTFQAGGTVSLGSTPQVSISNASVGNNGMEGIAYDARNGGSFVTVKQAGPQDILAGGLNFSNGQSTMSQLFDPALLGLASFSDVATLSSVDSLIGTGREDNLLILSLDSRKLVETNRQGQIQSVLDLTNILAHNGIEGVTVDELGNIYLVAEQIQDGTGGANPQSQLIVLAAIPEPGTALFGMVALGAIGLFSRRRTAAVATAC